ncbi:MAG: alpha-amylase family glycosyl hydrolase [Candidatus Hydrogenedentota bacterium]
MKYKILFSFLLLLLPPVYLIGDNYLYEAEEAQLVEAGVNTNHSGYSGRGFVDRFDRQGVSVRFDVNVPVSDIYELSVRYANSMGKPAMHKLYIDGTYISSIEFPQLGVPHTAWDKWSISSISTNIPEGRHIIELQFYETPINIDYLELKTSYNTEPLARVNKYKEVLNTGELLVFDASMSCGRNAVIMADDKIQRLDIILPIEEIEWKQLVSNPEKVNILQENSKALIRFPVAGKYGFHLRVRDKYGWSKNNLITVTIKDRYHCISRLGSLAPDDSETLFRETGPDRYVWISEFAKQSGFYIFKFVKNGDLKSLFHPRVIKYVQKNYVVQWTYEEKLQRLTCNTFPGVKFVYNPEQDIRLKNIEIKNVAIAGTFNGWNKTANFLAKNSDGSFSMVLSLAPGLYHYKFVVNGEIWLEDLTADPNLRIDDGQGRGEYNSGILVKSGKKREPVISHNPRNFEHFNPVNTDFIQLGIDLPVNKFSSVNVILKTGKKITLKKLKTVLDNDYYSANLQNIYTGTHLQYIFELVDSSTGKKFYYGKKQRLLKKFGQDDMFIVRRRANLILPGWAKDAVWYQIFPERFRNGDTSNDPDEPGTYIVPWTCDWYKPYTSAGENSNFFDYVWKRRYGGDLQGVINKLQYLKDLGINAIYFNPVFEAVDYHKYDASDYRHIDDNFGYKGDNKNLCETLDPETWQFTPTDKLFLKLIEECHKQGIKVIIDGVFNHTGREFFAFRNILDKGIKSEYRDWYNIIDWGPPVQVEGWAGFQSLPAFKEDDNGLVCGPREFIFNITKRWMDPDNDGDPDDGIDGWRLDVPEEVNIRFWKDWRKLVKSINPDAYLTGEIWHPAQDWLNGIAFDANMNYPFTDLCVRFFIDREYKPSILKHKLEEYFTWYKPQTYYVLQNLLGSHDTNRFHSSVRNPNRHDFEAGNRVCDGDMFDESKPTAEDYRISKQVITFQMTFVGAPMIYYGDEAGMWGADDPSDRKPMLWQDLEPYENPQDTVNPDLLNYYRKLIAIRHTYPELRYGDIEVVLTDDDKGIFGFKRSYQNEEIYVILNVSDSGHTFKLTTNNCLWFDAIQSTDYTVISKIVDGLSRNIINWNTDKLVIYDPSTAGALNLSLPPRSSMILIKLQ